MRIWCGGRSGRVSEPRFCSRTTETRTASLELGTNLTSETIKAAIPGLTRNITQTQTLKYPSQLCYYPVNKWIIRNIPHLMSDIWRIHEFSDHGIWPFCKNCISIYLFYEWFCFKEKICYLHLIDNIFKITQPLPQITVRGILKSMQILHYLYLLQS